MQQFKGDTLTKTKVVNNILRVWHATADHQRHDWYEEAHQFCLSLTNSNLCISKVCGIVAALSPLKQWNENKRIAKLFIQGHRISLHTSRQMDKALQISLSDGSDEAIEAILSGEKTKAFYRNIRHFLEVDIVTIDRHALSIAVGRKITDDNMQMSIKQYRFFETCYIHASKKIGVRPSLLQSATWLLWRAKNQTSLF